MIISKNIMQYLVLDKESICDVLKKIDSNEEGLVICVDKDGVLLGVLTDGDFRRWALTKKNIDLNQSIEDVINKDIVSAKLSDSTSRMESLFGQRITFIPLVDTEGRCVAVAKKRTAQFSFDKHKIGEGKPCFIIAEIGNNHNGSFELACQLVDQAVLSGADCAKFQMRDMSALYKNNGSSSDVKEDLGSQYTLDLLSRFQLDTNDMFRIFDYCVSKGITPLCTPWDIPSVEALEGYGITAYKSASADFTNHDLLKKLVDTGKPIICSTGMSSESEVQETVQLFRDLGAQYALLHCNSTYPAPFKDLNLKYLHNLRQLGNCPIGYSSHDRGINIAVAAVAMGANIIEKHFTLDRSMEGNDHRVSLLPQEFADMVEGIRQVEAALGSVAHREMSQGELMNRETLGKSLVITTDLKKGEIIESHIIDVCSPGQGLQPNRKTQLIGKVAKRDFICGDIFFPSDLRGDSVKVRNYKFSRPFGIAVRYHDLSSLAKLSNFDLLEFHLSYKDMEEDESKYFESVLDMDLVVHAPELFEGDHVLDLCSLDEDYRNLSIANLEKVIEVTLRLNKWFSRSKKPCIVVNVGGFTQDEHMSKPERLKRYDMVIEALNEIDTSGVEIIPQSMPPFPWHFGGQRFQNLFMDPDETVEFCEKHNYRICLDISHSKLACNHHHWSFSDFVRKVGPYTAHLHIVDASGVDGEGLQIDEGDIDFPVLGRDLKEFAPAISFIPEIWQGHKNGGEGFWLALERLEKYL